MAMAPRGSFKETALKRLLPEDKLSSTFKTTLDIVDGLEDAFYAVESAGNDIANAVDNAATTVANAAESAWDDFTGLFS